MEKGEEKVALTLVVPFKMMMFDVVCRQNVVTQWNQHTALAGDCPAEATGANHKLGHGSLKHQEARELPRRRLASTNEIWSCRWRITKSA